MKKDDVIIMSCSVCGGMSDPELAKIPYPLSKAVLTKIEGDSR